MSARIGSLEIAELLLEHSADTLRRHLGMTPELLAIRVGHQDVANLLAAHQATRDVETDPVDGRNMLDKHSLGTSWGGLNEALLEAVGLGSVAFCTRLLDEGADPNHSHPTCQACTVLNRALKSKQPEIAKLLVQKGAMDRSQTCDHGTMSDESVSKQGYSAQHFAAALGLDEILELILAKESDHHQDDPVTPLQLAAGNGHLSCVKMIVQLIRSLDVMDDPAYVPKHFLSAIAESSTEEGNDPLTKGRTGKQDNKNLRSRVRDSFDAILVENELEHPWRLTTQIKTDTVPCFTGSALHLAVAGQHKDVAAYLLQQGANVDLKDGKGWTPLHIVCYTGCCRTTRLLYRHGANVNTRNCSLQTPLHIVAQVGLPWTVDELLLEGADPTLRDSVGWTPLDYALSRGSTDIVSSLMGYANKGWWTLFSKLVEEMKKKGLEYAMDEPVNGNLPVLCLISGMGRIHEMRAMLDAGANIEVFAEPYGTPLGIACAMGQLNAVKFLIARGGRTVWKAPDGRIMSAIELAEGSRHVSQRSRHTLDQPLDSQIIGDEVISCQLI
ncbi:hypothetical protein MMC25_000490 [Agyrium rufum]|nr:hypothetical protein [Agyrium rufum]